MGLMLFSSAAMAQTVIPGKVVTGFNRYLDQPYLDFGDPLGPANFAGVAEFNPDGPTPTGLDANTSGDALLVTILDPTFLAFVGVDPANTDPSLVNVRLRDVATNVSLNGQTRAPIPSSDDVNLVTNAQHGSAAHINLATWRKARGALEIECHEDGTSSFSLWARQLLPNRLYSIWGNYFRPDIPDPNTGFPLPILAHAIGGLPNAFISNDAGQGTFFRTLSECPLVADDVGRRLLAVDLIFHSDHQLVGTLPSIPRAGGGLGQGAVSHPQLAFNVAGLSLGAMEEGWGDSGTCLPSSTTHCFRDGRFQVDIEWTNFNGTSGPGRTADLGSESGSFYFFSSDNKEVLVKVLDGCSFNNHFWVFAALATNVEYTLTVTDTQTGATKTYNNSAGVAAPAITDTNAFATCP